MELRLETPADYQENEILTRKAFWDIYGPGCSEHLVLHKLRSAKSFIKELDYLAVQGDKIVGNIAYTKMFYADSHEMCNDIIAFGPISVHPDYQRMGIGKQLIEFTTKRARELGFKAVFITGDHKYYHPLGFSSASGNHIYLVGTPETEENEFFMAKELEEGYLQKLAGRYEFDSAFEITEVELADFDKGFFAG